MTRTSMIAASLALLTALPASAQQVTVHNGPCAQHGSDQVRCALRVPMAGQYRQTTMLMTRGNGNVTGIAQAWLSECGLPGQAGTRTPVTNERSAHTVSFTTTISVALVCPEIFVFNCQENGQPVPCSKGFANATIRMELQQ